MKWDAERKTLANTLATSISEPQSTLHWKSDGKRKDVMIALIQENYDNMQPQIVENYKTNVQNTNEVTV